MYRFLASANTAKLTVWAEGDATVEFGWDDGHKQGADYTSKLEAVQSLERMGFSVEQLQAQ